MQDVYQALLHCKVGLVHIHIEIWCRRGIRIDDCFFHTVKHILILAPTFKYAVVYLIYDILTN